ncbi:MAG: hypothetical protein ACRCS0_05010 [Albidovulum sp.]
MLTYKIATASVTLCSGLLLASYLKAAEVEPAAALEPPVAQMNRALYIKPAEVAPKPVMTLPRRPITRHEPAPVSAQMNRVLYGR